MASSDVVRAIENLSSLGSTIQKLNIDAFVLNESILKPYRDDIWPGIRTAIDVASRASQAQYLAQMPGMISALQGIQATALAQMADAFAPTDRLLDSIAGIEAFRNQIAATMGVHDQWMKQISKDLSSMISALLPAIPTDVFSDLANRVRHHQDAVEAFQSGGWPIAPSMPSQLIERVIEHYGQGERRYISRSIIGYYQRNNNEALMAAVSSWETNPLFAPRMHILRDALQAHCEGKYTLSVPAVLPQIEGVLSDFVSVNNLPAKLGRPKEVYTQAIGELNEYGLLGWIIASTLLHHLETNTYVHTDFQAELKRSVNRRRMTRHTVMHGIAPKYDRHVHSLRAFLLLDAVSALCEPSAWEFSIAVETLA